MKSKRYVYHSGLKLVGCVLDESLKYTDLQIELSLGSKCPWLHVNDVRTLLSEKIVTMREL